MDKPEQTCRLDFTDDERAEITAYSMECLAEFINDNDSDAWFGLQCKSGRTFDINIFGTDEWDLDNKATCWAYHVDADGQTKTHISEHLWIMPIDAGAVTLRGKQLDALKTLIDYNWNDEAKSYAESGLPLNQHIFGNIMELSNHMGRVNRG